MVPAYRGPSICKPRGARLLDLLTMVCQLLVVAILSHFSSCRCLLKLRVSDFCFILEMSLNPTIAALEQKYIELLERKIAALESPNGSNQTESPTLVS